MTTFVLIHGAYQGGWAWQPVADRLAAEGHRVLHPSLEGCAERAAELRPGITTETHAAEIAELLEAEGAADVTLVGTSSGGMVLCRAAELARAAAPDRVGRVVFVDALALRDGEAISDFVERVGAETTDLATGPSRADLEGRLYTELTDDVRALAIEQTTPHPVAVMEEPVHLDAFWDQEWTADVVYCTESTNPPEAHQRRTADALDAGWHVIETGHYPMLSAPDELTAILLG